MAHTTRSGKVFKTFSCGGAQQDSCWAQPSDVLLKMLPINLANDKEALLQARLVCREWRSAFGPCLRSIQLQQPVSTVAARAMGRKAAAAFSNAETAKLELYHESKEGACDLTGDAAVWKGNAAFENAAAAAALLRPLGKLTSLTQLTLSNMYGECGQLPTVLPLLPRLHLLDLSQCQHPSSDLLMIVQHMPQLQQLVLPCPGRAECDPQHIAALAGLPQLRSLELLLPPVVKRNNDVLAAAVVEAVAQLTQLTALHIIGRDAFEPADVHVSCLSRLTGLQELVAHAGPRDGEVQAKGWGEALLGMQQLTRLELRSVVVSDALLEGIGRAGLPLQQLVLHMGYCAALSQTTSVGARAVAGIPHIEVKWCKCFTCRDVWRLLQLPSLKRMQGSWEDCVASFNSTVDGTDAWSQDHAFAMHAFPTGGDSRRHPVAAARAAGARGEADRCSDY